MPLLALVSIRHRRHHHRHRLHHHRHRHHHVLQVDILIRANHLVVIVALVTFVQEVVLEQHVEQVHILLQRMQVPLVLVLVVALAITVQEEMLE